MESIKRRLVGERDAAKEDLRVLTADIRSKAKYRRETYEGLVKEKKEAQEQYLEAKEKLEVVTQANRALNEENASLKQAIDRQQKQLGISTSKFEEAKKALNSQKEQFHAELRRQAQNVEELNTQNLAYVKQNKQLRVQLQEQSKTLGSQNAQFLAERNEALNEVERVKEENNSLKARTTNVLEANKELQSELDQVRKSSQQLIDEQRQQISQQQGQINHQQGEINQQKKKIAQQQHQISQQNRMLEKAETQLQTAKQQMQTIQQTNQAHVAENTKLEAELKKVSSLNGQMEKKLQIITKKAKARIEELQNNLTENNTKLQAEKTSLQRQVDESLLQMEKLTNQNKQLQAQMKQTIQGNITLVQKLEETDAIKQTLSAAQQGLKSTRLQLQQCNVKYDGLLDKVLREMETVWSQLLATVKLFGYEFDPKSRTLSKLNSEGTVVEKIPLVSKMELSAGGLLYITAADLMV